MARPRTKPAKERKIDLIDSALQLFQTQGVEPTTIEQITIGAGVAKGTFYLHFASKEGILDSLRARFVQDLLEGIENATAKKRQHDLAAKLSAWVKACFTGYLESAKLHDIVFLESPPSSADGMSSNPIIDHLADLLTRGHEKEGWKVADSHFTAVFLFNGLHGIVNEARRNLPRAKRAEIIEMLQQHFARAVGLA